MTDTLLRRGLKLSHIAMIDAFADAGQIGAAAAKLGITQPAASRLMAEIERILGHPVHVRTGRGVALTHEGEALARRAARILMEVGAAAREVQEIADGIGGHVHIGSVTGPAMDRVLPAIRAARFSLPGVSIEVEVATSDILCGQLLAGQIDFALARLPTDADPRLFDVERMGTEPVSLVARRGHALATRAEPPEPHDLMQYDWILPGPGAILRRTVEKRLRDLGLPEASGRLSTSSFLLTLALLQQSNAIAPLATAVARQFAARDDAPYAILPIDLGIEVESYGLMTRSGTRLTPAADRVRALIQRTRAA
jgi:DNA-binding transcriptional LysR family regulator